MIPTAVVLLAVLFAQETATPQRFDLICTNIRDATERRPALQADLRFRIDLVDKRYCVGPCSDIRPLTVYDETLVFTQTPLSANAPFLARQSVDRHTGEYEFTFINDGRISRQDKGTCTTAPYTGSTRGERLF